MTDTVTLYALDALGQWTGDTLEVDPREGWRAPWAYAPEAPPVVDVGQVALLSGEAWIVVDQRAGADLVAARTAKRAAIDAAFLVRNTANFPWDFGAIETVDDLGVSVGPAGVRSLQIRNLEDKTNWTAAHTVAMAALALGAPETIVPLKCDDNVWVQTTAIQTMQVLALGVGDGEAARISLFQRQAANLARYGALKKLWAGAADAAALDAIDEADGWPRNLGDEP